MNIFPLLWSFGLSFFSYRANRAKPPAFVGLENYEKVLTDPIVWDRLQDDGHPRRHDGHGADDRRVPACLPLRQAVPASALSADPRADADDAVLRRGRRLLPLLLRTDLRASVASRCGSSPASPYILLETTAGAMAGIVFADAWMWSPFVMLLVLAGLVSVPKYLYEAAEIDRASFWRKFYLDHLPLHPRAAAARPALPYDRGVQALRRRVPADGRWPGHRRRRRSPSTSSGRRSSSTRPATRPRSPTSCSSP